MNTENTGDAVAMIKTTRTKKPCIVSVSDKTNLHTYPEIKLTGEDSFIPCPNQNKERDILYITGASGSGKSFYTKMYADEYAKMYPKNMIFLFSSITEDSSIDKIKKLKRIKLTKEFEDDNDLSAKDFENSLCIFDDTDCITNKKLRNRVNSVLNSILETGRHTGTSCIYTSHVATSGIDTKKILNESHSITIFPKSLGGRSLKYLLSDYLGMDKQEIKKIKKLPSRWVTINKTYPKCVTSEKEAYIIDNSVDDD